MGNVRKCLHNMGFSQSSLGEKHVNENAQKCAAENFQTFSHTESEPNRQNLSVHTLHENSVEVHQFLYFRRCISIDTSFFRTGHSIGVRF